ncbi:hypothetical protein BXZ70DRAFT_938118 [Cristinia sonorae]|uniref:ARID domain-containing protein n=1 Tax=Cristinia sonorae TaxID=1940300 RepID=A0A8K0XQ11_9AGAR|nr:hypothetical protein BXZ70DRAFT_938118 [Cristinia sonorae]
MDPFAAKQMAALQATSLAKAANRSAPGGTSASYFGGMSSNNPTRPDLSSGQDIMNGNQPFPPNAMPAFQAQQHNQPSPHPNPAGMQQSSHHSRKRSFLNGMASIMLQRSAPLPPALTGIPYPPGYDPSTSPWRSLDVSPNEVGIVRLAGKDIDLFKLWALALQLGGGQKVSAQGMWGQLLPQFDLQEHITQPNGQQQQAAVALGNLYNMLIGPFESAYRKNMQEQQHRAMVTRTSSNPQVPGHQRPDGMSNMPANFPPQMNALQRQPSNPNMNPASMGGLPTPSQAPDLALGMGGFPTPQNIPQTPQQFPGFQGGQNPRANLGLSEVPVNGAPSPQPGANGFPPVFSGTVPDMGVIEGDPETELRKRKLRESEEVDGKRVRQKTSGSDTADPRASLGPPSMGGQAAATVVPGRTIRQPSRRKIEYVPYAREVETAGGRDLNAIVHELNAAAHRPMRHIDEWGSVDIDALTMSLRSRIATELSYALTTFTILTLMRGTMSGFPVTQAPDLFEELLDLIEELAFDEAEDGDGQLEATRIITHREIVSYLNDDGAQPFAGLETRQGAKDPSLGPKQRPGNIIRTIMNILRNLSNTTENHDYFAKHDRLLTVILRLCALKPSEKGAMPAPASLALSLQDLVAVRKDATLILVNIGYNVKFAAKMPPTTAEARTARRAYELLAAYLIDLEDAVSPLACMMQGGVVTQMHHPKPPSSTDSALEAFTRIAQADDNRQVFSKAVPEEWLWSMFEALAHRLPVVEQDFNVIMREVWLAYFERIIHSLYSLSFLSPPSVKQRVKEDKRLRFPKLMLRLIKKLSGTPRDLRHHFMVSVRRAVETVKLIDDGEDSFDTSHSSTMPTLSFGMGYGEHGETRLEKGMGLLSGYQEDITMGIMMSSDLDDMMFSELASLVRVG